MSADIDDQFQNFQEKGRFRKQRGTVFLEDGKIFFPVEKFFDRDLSYQFTTELDKFLGEFNCEYYHLSRRYLETNCKRKNLRLYYTHAQPFRAPKANFLLIHGFGEHSSRYMDVLDHLAINDYSVHMIDLSGFGQSGGHRGNSTMEELHEDIEHVLKMMSPDLPLFVFGHSMGGGLVSTLMIRNPGLNIAGVICSSALLGYPNNRHFPWWLKKAFQFSGPVLDDVVVNSYINGSALSKNNYHVKKIIEDRLINPFLSMRAAKTIFGMIEFAIPNAHKLLYPLLVIHGKADIVTSPHDSLKFYKRAGSKDKTIKIIQHAYHEPMHDMEASEYKQHILDFLEDHYKTAPKFGVLTKVLRKGFPTRTKQNLLFLLAIVFLLSIIKRLQLFTHILPVRHIMMRLFKYH